MHPYNLDLNIRLVMNINSFISTTHSTHYSFRQGVYLCLRLFLLYGVLRVVDGLALPPRLTGLVTSIAIRASTKHRIMVKG